LRARAILDADFIITVFNLNSGKDLFCDIFSRIGYLPVVHDYVFTYETISCKRVLEECKTDGCLLVLSPCFANHDEEMLYEIEFRALYKEVNFSILPERHSIWNPIKEGSMGEIHSVLLASKEKIPVFLSNDGSVKRILVPAFVSRQFGSSLIVMNMKEVLKELRGKGKQLSPAIERSLVQ